jgi:hypothetical protein
MTATPNFASDALTGAEAAGATAPAAGASPFVLHLCSSTTPMALAQTDLPELKRFTFFVSRRFEEGRERFRLHMGYFATLAEAEEWLTVVREIYPGAWAGEAPGRKLRERAAAAAAAQAQHAAGPQRQVAPAVRASAPVVSAPARTAPAAPPRAAQPPPMRVPVVHAAPPAAQRVAAAAAPAARPAARPTPPRPAARPPGSAPAPRAQTPQMQTRAAPGQAAAATRVAVRAPAQQAGATRAPAAAAQRGAPQRPAAPRPNAPVRPGAVPAAGRPAQPAAAAASRPAPPAAPAPRRAFNDSNVREVLKALDDASATGETRLMHAPPAPRVATTAENSSLSDTQVLKLLEARRAEAGGPAPPEVMDNDGGIPLLKPDDTGTRQALKEAVASNEPVSFAVQLQWSVQPVELDKVPPLAIFSAYTLYTVEGSRDGRKWYGLRLGFFSDAISAKQVAYYVRSEFTSVAVVPVSPQEKGRASDQDKAAALTGPAPAPAEDPMDEFKLFDDSHPASAPSVLAPAAVAAATAAGGPAKPQPKVAVGRTVRQSAGPAQARTGGKVGARDSRGPQTLEETLEILGASQLTIEPEGSTSINDSAVRHLRVEVQKNSPFSKLLERLSERLKKP